MPLSVDQRLDQLEHMLVQHQKRQHKLDDALKRVDLDKGEISQLSKQVEKIKKVSDLFKRIEELEQTLGTLTEAVTDIRTAVDFLGEKVG